MFYLAQFNTLFDAIKEVDPDAKIVPSSTIIQFKLPNGKPATAQYIHHEFDNGGGSEGTIMLTYDDRRSEFDSLSYAVDGIEGLARQNNEDTSSEDTFENLSTEPVDCIANDIVYYLYDHFPEASYVEDIDGKDGSILMRFDFKKTDKKAVASALKKRYGDRIGFGHGNKEYAPEIKFDVIQVFPPESSAINESTENPANKFVLIEDFPEWAIEPMVNGTWGDYLSYSGEENAREDFRAVDNFMKSNGLCDIIPASDDEYESSRNEFCAHPAFGKGCSTCNAYGVKGEWSSLVDQYELGTNDTADSMNESAEGPDSGMYSIEDDTDDPNIFIIVLSGLKGWDLDTAQELASILSENSENNVGIFYGGSYSLDGYSEFQIFVDNSNASKPVTPEELAPAINDGISEVFGTGEYDDDNDVERNVGDAIDTAMMDHYDSMNGDIGDIYESDLRSSIKSICDKAGNPALTESVLKLHDIYFKPKMESETRKHRIPRAVAEEANDIIAKECGWSDELKQKEFDANWDWLEDYADAFIPAWNKTHDVGEGLKAIYAEEENQVMAAECSML